MASAADTFAPLIRAVAIDLLGKPDQELSSGKVLRWGSRGSFKIDVPDGVWYDNEGKAGGGTIDLVMREAGCDKAGALAWLESKGHIEPRAAEDKEKVFYDYRDETGAVAFRVERRGHGAERNFYQHGPDGNGGFWSGKGCMQGVRRVLYRLPELMAADPALIVFVCEGEKDADRLGKAGLIATTNPGGAGKFLREFAPMLTGRRVVVLEDNDQAGKDHAADVKAKLEGVAAEVAVLRLPGGEKSDVSDWLNAGGGSAFELERLAGEALAKAGPDLLPTLDLAALSRQRAKAVEFAIERIAPAGEVTLFTGPGSGGKSLLAQQLCTVSAAALAQCLGLSVVAGPALYATCEDTAVHMHFRQERLCEALGVDMASLAGKLYLTSLRGELGNELEGRDEAGDYAPSPAYHRLAATIKRTGAKLVALDNVAHLFAGNENDRHDVTRFVNLLNRLAGETGAAIILVGHPNKSGDTYSGSTAWLNAVRSQVWLDHQRDGDGHVLDQDARVLTIGKANYAPKGNGVTFRWHQWAFVLEDDLPPDTREEIAEIIKANGENIAFLACLRVRTEQGDGREVGPSPGPNYAPSQFEGMAEAKGYRKATLRRAMERLFTIGKITSVTVDRPGKSGKKTIIVEVPEPSPNAPRTPFPNDPEPPPERSRTHTASTTYLSGGPLEAPDPEEDDLDWGDQERGDD